MKVIEPSYEIVNDAEYPNVLKKIERIARICYKSEDRITPTSYIKMIKGLLEKKHTPMFEHGNLAYVIDERLYEELIAASRDITTLVNWMPNVTALNINRLHVTQYEDRDTSTRYMVSGNIRVWYEFFTKVNEFSRRTEGLCKLYAQVNFNVGNLFELYAYDNFSDYRDYTIQRVVDFNQVSLQERFIHQTFTVIFTCDTGVTHELVRMRDASFAQESTRYCNYQNDRFGNEITCIKPVFFKEGSYEYVQWYSAMSNAEMSYFNLLNAGATPQQARTVLPKSVKADIAVTCNWEEWTHIFKLRALDMTGPAHPQMKELMVPLYGEIKKANPEMISYCIGG